MNINTKQYIQYNNKQQQQFIQKHTKQYNTYKNIQCNTYRNIQYNAKHTKTYNTIHTKKTKQSNIGHRSLSARSLLVLGAAPLLAELRCTSSEAKCAMQR